MFIYNSPIGSLAIEMLDGKIIRIELVNHEKGHCFANGTTDETVCIERWLDSYFSGETAKSERFTNHAEQHSFSKLHLERSA